MSKIYRCEDCMDYYSNEIQCKCGKARREHVLERIDEIEQSIAKLTTMMESITSLLEAMTISHERTTDILEQVVDQVTEQSNTIINLGEIKVTDAPDTIKAWLIETAKVRNINNRGAK